VVAQALVITLLPQAVALVALGKLTLSTGYKEIR